MKTIPDAIKSRMRQEAAQTSDTVNALPPGYIKGFTLSSPDGVLQISSGIANIKGARTVLKDVHIVKGEDYVNPSKILLGLWYYVYVGTQLEFRIDVVAPEVNNKYFAYYHPQAETYRYIGQFYYGPGGVYQNIISYNPMEFNSVTTGVVDSLLLSVETFLKVGYKGTGTFENPHEADTFLYIDGDEIQVVEYTGGEWIPKLKIGGDNGGTDPTFRPLFSGIGLDHIDDQEILGEPIPTTGTFLHTFANVWVDQYGYDNWHSKGTLTYFATSAIYLNGYYLATSQTTSDSIRMNNIGNIDESFSTAFEYSILDNGTGFSYCSIFARIYNGSNMFVLYYERSAEQFELRINKGGNWNYVYLKPEKQVGTSGYWYLAVSYDADTDTVELSCRDLKTSTTGLTGTWTSGAAFHEYSLINQFVAGGYVTQLGETVYNADYVSVDKYIEHFNRRVPYTTERSRADQVIYCAQGGRIRFVDHMPEESLGTLHMIAPSDRPTSWLIANASSSTYTDVDCSAYLPTGVTAIMFSGVFNATATNASLVYLRAKGETTDHYSQSLVEEIYYSQINANRMYMRRQVVVPCNINGVIQYRTQYGSLYLALLGYYI